MTYNGCNMLQSGTDVKAHQNILHSKTFHGQTFTCTTSFLIGLDIDVTMDAY